MNHCCWLAVNILGVKHKQLGCIILDLVGQHQQVPGILLVARGVSHKRDVPGVPALAQRPPHRLPLDQIVFHHRVERRNGSWDGGLLDARSVAVPRRHTHKVGVHAREVRREVCQGLRDHHLLGLQVDHVAVKLRFLQTLLQYFWLSFLSCTFIIVRHHENIRHPQGARHVHPASDEDHLVLVVGVVPCVHDVIRIARVRLYPHAILRGSESIHHPKAARCTAVEVERAPPRNGLLQVEDEGPVHEHGARASDGDVVLHARPRARKRHLVNHLPLGRDHPHRHAGLVVRGHQVVADVDQIPRRGTHLWVRGEVLGPKVSGGPRSVEVARSLARQLLRALQLERGPGFVRGQQPVGVEGEPVVGRVDLLHHPVGRVGPPPVLHLGCHPSQDLRRVGRLSDAHVQTLVRGALLLVSSRLHVSAAVVRRVRLGLETDPVHHPVSIEPVVLLDGLERGVGAITQVHAVQVRRELARHLQIVEADLVLYGRKVLRQGRVVRVLSNPARRLLKPARGSCLLDDLRGRCGGGAHGGPYTHARCEARPSAVKPGRFAKVAMSYPLWITQARVFLPR
mmetsp:Transcript_15474/g.29857  ORF Transcript_15474/g.29857 Transcript_15474/m.29857 type:complete len:568 (+) Transcript_15474:645-2348(+)